MRPYDAVIIAVYPESYFGVAHEMKLSPAICDSYFLIRNDSHPKSVKYYPHSVVSKDESLFK